MSTEWQELPTRPMYWSVRRELWENRSIYLAPLVVAAIALFASSINTLASLPRKMRLLSALDPAKQSHAVVQPFSMVASVILLTGFLVAVFYCLEALQSERRDRSILFWKSLPVSDRTTVLSKASIPFAVIPLLCFAIALAVQIILLMLSTVVMAGSGLNPAMLWARLPLIQMTLVMFYGLLVHVLWFAPIYGWLLLLSAWTRRMTFLWAVLPFAAILIVERIALGTSHFASLLRYRLMGAMTEAFAVDASRAPVTALSQLDPLRFLTSSGLWIGLLLAAGCLAAAVRLRRKREPI
ncbi:MAG TPA: ABC transporter permease [Thermoanaerobaculia bacterium]|jgi:ABC-2 type transport system permease protein|nr:ABC transporter permease [Thermoanaerobaculia bacterium]